MAESFAVTVKNGTVLHIVEGSLRGYRFEPVTTTCGRTVRPLNVFRDLEGYRKGYNVNGRLCAQCARRLTR